MTIFDCPDCGAPPGAIHRENCPQEACLRCGKLPDRCLKHPKTEGERLPWGGLTQGVAECLEFGWFCRWNSKARAWLPCEPTARGAEPDLDRLRIQARWNPHRRRFILRKEYRPQP
jgi:hypothetical protein